MRTSTPSLFLAFLVRFRVGFRFFYHAVYFVLTQRTGRSDGNLLFLAGAQILGAYVYDTVGIDIERNFNLRNSAGSCRDAAQLETAQGLVVCRHIAFALQHMDINGRLVIRSCRESGYP